MWCHSPTAGATTAPERPFGVAGQRPGVNSNLLTDDTAIDPLSGNAVLNGIAVTVSPSSPSS